MKPSRFTTGSKKMSKETVRNVLIGIYVVVVIGLSVTAKAEQDFMPVRPSEKWEVTHVSGLLVHTVGQWELVVSETERYSLVTNLDLTDLDRKAVRVIGIGAKVNTGLHLEESLVPLTEDPQQPELPVLNVLEISEE